MKTELKNSNPQNSWKCVKILNDMELDEKSFKKKSGKYKEHMEKKKSSRQPG